MSIEMALDAILDKKGRSFLTMLGIIIGVCAVLVLVAMVTGYNSDVTSYYEKLGVNKVNVSITYYDSASAPDINAALYEYCNTDLSGMVEGVTPDISTTGTVKYRSGTVDTSTIYLGGNQFAVCSNYTLKSGRDIAQLDIDRRSPVCVIGSYVADMLFGYADPLGKTIYYNGYPLTVVGTYYMKDGSSESSMDDMIVMPYSLQRTLLGTDYITSYVVKVGTSGNMEKVITALTAFMDENVNEYIGDTTLKNGNSSLTETTEEMTSMSVVLGGIAAIALLVGGIGIMNIMLVTVTERTREIGIKKAVGAPRSVIIQQFLVESSVLSALGGVIGIILGYGLSLILNKALYGIIVFPNGLVTFGAFIFSIAIGIGFGIYPAVKASGLEPVEALRAD